MNISQHNKPFHSQLRGLQFTGLIALLLLFTISCDMDFLDPTPVENPQATDEDLANSANPTRALLPGIKIQFSRAIGGVVITTEFVSDNASINGTGIGGTALDFPRNIAGNTPAINSTGTLGSYWNLQELQAFSSFVIDEIIPGDETATGSEIAQAHYYRGMAFLMLGENFVAAPVEENGAPVPGNDLIQRGMNDFQTVLDGSPEEDIEIATLTALARAHRALGNATEAASFAQEVLNADPVFVFSANYDRDNLFNRPWIYAVDRALKELQPSPRLDFLDPKYTEREDPIPVAKAEEMHLILAEVAMSEGNYTDALEEMALASDLALTVSGLRPRVTFSDGDERLNNQLRPRPRDEEIQIAADADSPFRSGLVLTRPGDVEVSKVSWTSITRDSLETIDASEEELLRRNLYSLRQEIMFYEGRRMHDLGIRLPIMQREWDNSPAISDGDFGTNVYVPDYIPSQNQIDLFSPFVPYDDDEILIETEVVMSVDMNRVLADPANRGLVVDNPFAGLY